MFARRTFAVLSVLMIAASLVPMAEAQGRGRGPLRLEWTAPDSVKAPNHTVDLSKDGAGTATLRVGYSGSNFGGFGQPPRICQPGTKLVVPLLVDATTIVQPHMVSITPAKAEFDIGQGVPSAPSGGGSQVRWSEKHVVSVHYEVANSSLTMATLNITTGPVSTTGGTCTSPVTVSAPAREFVNFTFPAKPVAVPAAVPAAESPGFDLFAVVLMGLVALALLARRVKA